MRISLIGPGDIDYHFNELLKMPQNKLASHTLNITKALLPYEIVLLPDRGLPFEIAKRYKQMKGKKVIGTVPKQDTTFGISHLKSYIDSGIFNEIIDTEHWYKQDAVITLCGDITLVLGYTLGSMEELTFGFYLYKLFKGYKPELNVVKDKVCKDAIVGQTIPFTVLIYKPFVKGKLSSEIEEYIKKSGGQIFYIKNPKELREKLSELKG